jgi:hypothetical protein
MPADLPSLLSSAHRLLSLDACRREEDVRVVAEFAARTKDAPVVGARVYWHCATVGDRMYEYDGLAAVDEAAAHVARLTARPGGCCTVTRVVYVLAVDVEVAATAEAGKDGG